MPLGHGNGALEGMACAAVKTAARGVQGVSYCFRDNDRRHSRVNGLLAGRTGLSFDGIDLTACILGLVSPSQVSWVGHRCMKG